jgi:hypothetical protein
MSAAFGCSLPVRFEQVARFIGIILIKMCVSTQFYKISWLVFEL